MECFHALEKSSSEAEYRETFRSHLLKFGSKRLVLVHGSSILKDSGPFVLLDWARMGVAGKGMRKDTMLLKECHRIEDMLGSYAAHQGTTKQHLCKNSK